MVHDQQIDGIDVHIFRNRKVANQPAALPPLPFQGSTPPPRILYRHPNSRDEQLGGCIDLEVGDQIVEGILRRFGRQDVDVGMAQRQRDLEKLLLEQTVDLFV